MRRLFNLLSLLWIAVFFTQCGGGGGDAPGPSNPSTPPATTVASVRMTPATAALGIGQTVVLRAEALDANGSVLPGKVFVFNSSNTAVASVTGSASASDPTATVAGVTVGTTTITAGVEGKTAAAAVTVTQNSPDNIPVTGRVVDGETQAGIAGATVSYRTDHGQAGIVATAGDGSFSFSFANDSRLDAYVLEATASANGYVTTRLGGARVRPSGHQIESILMVRERAVADGTIYGRVLDVRNGQAITGASVRLEMGQGFATAGPVATATSDMGGRYSFAGLAAGTYTVVANAHGYFIGSRTAITVVAGQSRDQDIGLSPVGNGSEVRIVLNWGSVPADLDAHLTGPNASGTAGRFHVSWDNRLRADAAPYAGLDRDDRDGHGPETITVTRLNNGVYRYSVRDFTNGSALPTQELGRSGASVQVFAGGRNYTFHVPLKPGNLWTVFEMAGEIANPVITERGEMATTSDSDPIP